MMTTLKEQVERDVGNLRCGKCGHVASALDFVNDLGGMQCPICAAPPECIKQAREGSMRTKKNTVIRNDRTGRFLTASKSWSDEYPDARLMGAREARTVLIGLTADGMNGSSLLHLSILADYGQVSERVITRNY